MEQQRSTQSRSVDDYITVIGDYLSSLVWFPTSLNVFWQRSSYTQEKL